MKKIVSFLLIAVMCFGACILSSCTTSASEISVNLSFTAGDDRIFSGKIKAVPEDTEKGASVIQIVNEAIAGYNLNIKLDANGNSVKDINKYIETTIDGTTYYWMYTINGVEPTAGKASGNYVKDGDTIAYVFYCSTPDPNNPTKANTAPYDSAMELFGEGEEETTGAEATETAAE